MNWKDYIEIVGILAILLGLFFVQSEIQLNSTIARAELSAETNRSLFELDQMLMQREMSTLWAKSIENPNELSFSERLQINNFLENVLVAYGRECYYMSLDIFVECESFPRGTATKYFGSEYGRAFWKTVRNRMIFSEISRVIDEALSGETAIDSTLQLDNKVLQNLRN